MEDCIICFCPFDKNEKKYTCVKKECKEPVCQECLFSLITFSENSNIIPKCPAENCNGIFTMSDIYDIPKNYLHIYASACFKYMMKDQGDTVKKRIQETKILADLRDERLKYLEKDYPKAISLIAKLTFKNKLRKLDKQKSKIVSAQVNKSTRTCMNLTCNGFLDPNFVCMTCQTEFCSNCEKKTKSNHICKQEDLDSINLVNNMVKCPGCKLPVFKNEGCDSITCSNCSTNFKYSDGKVGGHGSSNAKLQKTMSIAKKEKLSNIFEKKIDAECLELLLKLEALEPPVKRKDIILTPLKAYFRNKDEVVAGRKIAVRIDEYYNFTVNYRQYHTFLTKVEEKVLEKEDSDSLKKYLTDAITELNF